MAMSSFQTDCRRAGRGHRLARGRGAICGRRRICGHGSWRLAADGFGQWRCGPCQQNNYLFPAAFAPKGWRETGQASLSLNWEIDFWGKNRAALRAAKADRLAAGAEAAAARLAVSTGIATAYSDLAAAYAEQDAALEAEKIRARTLALIEQRRDQGLENEGAVARARANLATAQGDLAAIDEQIALNRHRLAALVGAGPDRGLAIARPAVTKLASPGLPANIPPNCWAVVRIWWPPAHADAAAERIKVARAAFYPNINLAGMIGLQSLGLSNLVKSGSNMARWVRL
jgi:outer membrane protein TolC